MSDQEIAAGPKIARRWRLPTAAFYGSIIALLAVLSQTSEQRRDRATDLSKSWIASMAERRP